jgi:AraC-like DNA-binding protein
VQQVHRHRPERRTRARIRAALELLASDIPGGTVAGRIGHRTPSAFVAAFRRVLGTAPAPVFGPHHPVQVPG